jgi:ferredoxin
MALKILNGCTTCGACEIECPNGAIAMGAEVFEISPDKCTECVGFHGFPQCATVCPVDVCVADPSFVEAEPELIARAKKMHPLKAFAGRFPSHFQNPWPVPTEPQDSL